MFLTAIRNIAASVRWMHFSNGQSSSHSCPTNVKCFSVFCMSCSKGASWNNSTGIGNPRARNIGQNLEIGFFMFVTTPWYKACSIFSVHLYAVTKLWTRLTKGNERRKINFTFPGISAFPCAARPMYNGVLP